MTTAKMSGMPLRTSTAALVALAAVTACSSSPNKTNAAPTGSQLLRADAARLAGDPAAVGPVVAGLDAFAAQVYREAAKAGGNVVVSPLSIALAFSMARAGAQGSTAAEIDRVLHFPASGRDAGFNQLTQVLKTTDNPPPAPVPGATRDPNKPPADPIVAIANGLFVQRGQTVGAPFLKTLEEQYGAGVRTVDFAAGGAEAINQWVRSQTAERITKLFDQLDPSTKLVLANAVYLKADWQSPFVRQSTTQDPFVVNASSSPHVATMHDSEVFGYAESATWQAVELPYAGGKLAMWVIVPKGSAAPASVLTAASLHQVGASLKPQLVDLSLPKWSFGQDLDLGTVMQSLGMQVAFSGQADFGRIFPGLFISQAVHRANITVDEYGTEAAAVTGLAFAIGGTIARPIAVKADHPFAFVIVDTATKAPVFMGSVSDPSKS